MKSIRIPATVVALLALSSCAAATREPSATVQVGAMSAGTVAPDQSEIEQARRDDYVAAHPDLSPFVLEAIREGTVVVGMTVADTEASVGYLKPAADSRGEGASVSVFTQMVGSGTTIYYFRDNKLTRWTTIARNS